MKFIIAVNHPSQFHVFKQTYKSLNVKGHDVIFVIKDKDILSDLMNNEEILYHKLLEKRIGSNKLSILFFGLFEIFVQGVELLKFVHQYQPDIMFGTDYSITHVGKLLGIPSIVFNEDDYNINRYFCNLSYPFASCIVSPSVCNVGKYEYKRINYNGYQKLAYLHPNIFQPNKSILNKYIDSNTKYYLVRLVSFSAGHDVESTHGGITLNVLEKIVKKLEKDGKVFISSEKKLPKEFLKYKLNINVKDIHHIMAFASLIIADSQSMIVEACMLGTPSIRFNSFVDKISVLHELEHTYSLTTGILNNRPQLLLEKITSLLKYDCRDEFRRYQKKMLAQKIDVSSFITWFVENYPKSEVVMRENPDYQLIFK